MTRLVTSSLVLAGLAALVGCSESTGAGGIDVPTNDAVAAESASAEIGPSGGALETDFGVSIIVPPGALDQEVEITATFDPIDQRLQLEPAGLAFDELVIVDLPALDDGDADVSVMLCCLAEFFDTCVAPGRDGIAAGHPWLNRSMPEVASID